MVKLYTQLRDSNSPMVEVTENTFQIDGYEVGDRVLEDVMFDVTFKNGKVTKVTVEPSAADYFEGLNTKMWLKEVKNTAQHILDDGGDEVYLSATLRRKYGNPKLIFLADVDNPKVEKEGRVISQSGGLEVFDEMINRIKKSR